MKKLKLNKKLYYQINEDDGTENNNQKYTPLQINLPEIVDKDITESITDSVRASSALVKFKLSTSLYHNIQFPAASGDLQRLMKFLDMPPAFKDLGDQLQSDPMKTIKAAPDLAYSKFNVVEFNINGENPKEDEEVSESFKYSINETDMGYAIGKTAGDLAVHIGTGVADSIGAFFNTIAPSVSSAAASAAGPIALAVGAAKAASYIGGMAAVLNADHDYYITNDKDLLVDYSSVNKESMNTNPDPINAIDGYIAGVQEKVAILLKQISAPSATGDIADLTKAITVIQGNAGKMVESFIKGNDEILKQKEEQMQRQLMQNARDEKDLWQKRQELTSRIYKNKLEVQYVDFLQYPTKSKYNLYYLEQELNKLGSVNDALNINFTNKLNENNNENIKEIIPILFDADKIYTSIVTMIRGKITKIVNTDPEEWRDIKWGRREMEAMRDAADKEIMAKIDIICRTNNTENMGLSTKLAAFIRKHPMRAERLKGVWSRHKSELNTRMERRLKNIYDPTGNSAMSMCMTFLVDTYPKLLAMMITYKSLIQILSDARISPKSLTIPDDEIEEKISNQKEFIITNFEYMLASSNYGKYLASIKGRGLKNLDNNGNTTYIYDVYNHKFDVKTLPYLGFFLEYFNDNKDYWHGGERSKLCYFILTMQGNISDAKIFTSLFFSYLSSINKLSICTADKFNATMKNAFEYIANNSEKIGIAENVYNELTSLSSEEVSNIKNNFEIFLHTLAYVIASKGEILNNYNKKKNEILKNIDKDDTKDKLNKLLEFDKIADDDAISDIVDNLKEKITVENLFGEYGYITNPELYCTVLNLYFDLQLYKCTKYENKNGEKVTNNNINFELVSTFVDMAIKHMKIFNIVNANIVYLNSIKEFADNYTKPESADELIDYLHSFTGITLPTNIKNKEKYITLLKDKLLSKQLLIKLPNNNDINTPTDIISKFGNYTQDNLEDFICKELINYKISEGININTAFNIFKEYIKLLVKYIDDNINIFDTTEIEEFLSKNDVINDEDSFKVFCKNMKIIFTSFQFEGTDKETIEKLQELITKIINRKLYEKYHIKLNDVGANYFTMFLNIDADKISVDSILTYIEDYMKISNMESKYKVLHFIPEIFKIDEIKEFLKIIKDNYVD